jgi:hypothetical protein
MLTDFHGDEAKKIKMADSKKLIFSTTPNSQSLKKKIPVIGPLVSTVN